MTNPILSSVVWEKLDEYITFQPMDVNNLLCLYGMHERYLNNIVQRYQENLIPDLFR